MRNDILVCAKRVRLAGAVSVLALLGAGCASYAGDGRSGYQSADSRDSYSRGYEDGRERDRTDYKPAGLDAGRGGIEAAREAHRRFSDYRAEQLDGDCETRVRIRSGETLSDLAEFCDVSVASIIDANPSIRNVRDLPIGAQFYIPSQSASVYRDAGDRYDNDGRDDNDDRYARDTDRDYYVVRRGDTLSGIAARYDVSLSDVARLNPRQRPRDLAIGDRIYLPDHARRDGYHRDTGREVSLGRIRPAVSFSPDRGPRNGDIRLIGDNFERGEQVAVLYGDSRERLSRIRTIEADQFGRINQIVRLPDTYRGEEAYFAMQRGNETYISDTAYALSAGEGAQPYYSSDNFGNGAGLLRRPGAGSPSAVLRAVDQEVYRNDTVTLSAVGFPSNTPVSIYGGPNRDTLTKISEIRTGPSGIFETEVSIPDNVDGDAVLFVAAVEDGARTFFTERVRVRTDDFDDDNRRNSNGGLSERRPGDTLYSRGGAADGNLSLDRGVDRGANGGSTFMSRFRKLNPSGPVNINAGGQGAISGVLTNEGKRCPTLRDDSGAIFSLLGDLRTFSDGDRVLIRGSTAADNRICNQSDTIQIFSIESAPW